MSIFLIRHRDLLERLRSETRSSVTEFQSAVDEAVRLYEAEREAAFKLRMRLRSTDGARGDHAGPPVPRETLEALEAMQPRQRELVSSVLEVVRGSPPARL